MNESRAGALRAGEGRGRQWLLRGIVVAAAGLGLAACAGPHALDGKRLEHIASPVDDVGVESARGPAERQKPYAARNQGRAETDGWGAAFDGRRAAD
jgi:hypothetical protein